jgi:ATP adenylyltransferase
LTGSPGFAPGTLLDAVRTVSARARASGALQPIATEETCVEDRGVRFQVRILSSLARKNEERARQEQEAAAGKPANPFLPYDPELFVADVSPTHAAILNKFKVVDEHLLVVTRVFEEQRSLLTAGDFDALWRCLGEYESLGFYNGGTEAGASQAHKHLQLVPLPLSRTGPAVPIAPLLAAAPRGALTTVPGFGFRHVFARFGGLAMPAPGEAHELYRAMLVRTGIAPLPGEDAALQRGPYCLLVTREWMLLVPRSREFFRGISINALGFAGALLVRDETQLRELRQAGPFAALEATAFPAEGAWPRA